MLTRTYSPPLGGASEVAIHSETEKSSTLQSESDGNDWFKNTARALLGSDPGLALHYLTNGTVGASTGYRYANGERQIPTLILRQIVHGEHGEAWLMAFMEGCTSRWWIEHQRALRIGKAAIHEASK